MTKGTHLGREGIYSLGFHAYISVIGISLHVDNSIEYMRIDDCIADKVHSLNIWTAVLDCIFHELPFLFERLVKNLSCFFCCIILTCCHGSHEGYT